MSYDYILAIDPSGNFNEGKGTTGFCLLNARKTPAHAIMLTCGIQASKAHTKEEYWQEHLNFIDGIVEQHKNIIIVIENFTLDPRRALAQAHSEMETPKLIGILQLYLTQHKIPYVMQRPSEVKNRWTDSILVWKKYLQQRGHNYILPRTNKVINRHEKDAVRHAVHYSTFKNKEET